MLTNRNLGLDLMRLFAFYFVLIEHGGKNPFGDVLLGGLGVEIFFVLSGFLIGRIIIREFKDFKGYETFRHFWVNRWFRTLPLYYLALLVQILLSNKMEWGYLYYLVFLQNNFYGISLFPISWSLVVEEWFYLGLPFVFFLFRVAFRKVSIIHLVVCVVLLLLIKGFVIYFRGIPFAGVNGNPLLRFDSMLIGVILAMLYANHKSVFLKMSGIVYFAIGLILTIVLQYLVFYHFGISSLDKLVSFNSVYFLVQSVFIGLMLPFLSESDIINNGILKVSLLRKFITWTSILSYSFYLFHMNLFHLVQFFNLNDLTFYISLVVLYIFSYFIYLLYEKPMTDLRRKFT